MRAELGRAVVGQHSMINGLLTGLICEGHILLEGAPGLAKTLTIRSLSEITNFQCQRIQFTPDLLPSDLIGTEMYHPKSGSFETRKGPIFANLILADEINRAPPKVQSALLEAMQERQVTIGDRSWPLPRPFLVLATQNPIDQEGTYPLPEAQADRFMLKVTVGYPSKDEEREVLLRGRQPPSKLARVAGAAELELCRSVVSELYYEPLLLDYIINLVRATRDPNEYGVDLHRMISYGASLRATMALEQASRVEAFFQGRAFVVPDDIKAVAPAVLRHRIVLSYESEADGVTTDTIIEQLLQHIPVP